MTSNAYQFFFFFKYYLFISSVTQVSDEVKRLRVPRFIKPDGIIRPYVKREAEGNKLLLVMIKC